MIRLAATLSRFNRGSETDGSTRTLVIKNVDSRLRGSSPEPRDTDEDEEGDVARWALMLERPGSRPVSLTAGGKTGFAYVTPDARFIFTEPLMAIDVRRWRRYALYSALAIAPYVSIDAVSADGRRLLISRRDCPYDCQGRPTEYFELTLPS